MGDAVAVYYDVESMLKYVTKHEGKNINLRRLRYAASSYYKYIYLAFVKQYEDKIVNKNNMLPVLTETQIWELRTKKVLEDTDGMVLAFDHLRETLMYIFACDSYDSQFNKTEFRDIYLKYYKLPSIIEYVKKTSRFREYIEYILRYNIPNIMDFLEEHFPDYATKLIIIKYIYKYNTFEAYMNQNTDCAPSVLVNCFNKLHKAEYYGEYHKYYEYCKAHIDNPQLYISIYKLDYWHPLRTLLEYATPTVDKVSLYLRLEMRDSSDIIALIHKGVVGKLNYGYCCHSSLSNIMNICNNNHEIFLEFLKFNSVDSKLRKLFQYTLLQHPGLISMVEEKLNSIMDIIPLNPDRLPFYKNINIVMRSAQVQKEITVDKIIKKYTKYIKICFITEDYRFLDMIVSGNAKIPIECIIDNREYLDYISTNRDLYTMYYDRFVELGYTVCELKSAA